jgi:multidrug efflux pump subunit AcrA (membrane-fusion protein)
MSQFNAPSQTAHHLPEQVQQLVDFEGAPNAYFNELASLTARTTDASAVAIVRVQPESRNADLIAIWPEAATAQAWADRAAEASIELHTGDSEWFQRDLNLDTAQGPIRATVVAIPIPEAPGNLYLTALLPGVEPAKARAVRDRFELLALLPALRQSRRAERAEQARTERLTAALDIATGLSPLHRFRSLAYRIVNDLAARLNLDRVALGMIDIAPLVASDGDDQSTPEDAARGTYIKLAALSGTEKISPRMRLVQDLISAMEECFDQDTEIRWPLDPQEPVIARAIKAHAEHSGPLAAVLLPLRSAGRVVGVLAVERDAARPFLDHEVAGLRVLCELVTPRLLDARERDRWIGAKIASSARHTLAGVLGPTHTWIKLTAAILAVVGLSLVVVPMPERATGAFSIAPVQRQVVPAPFDGFIESVSVRVDQRVEAGETVLATLSDQELALQLSANRAAAAAAMTEASKARSEGKLAEAAIAERRADEIRATVDLLASQLNRARLVAPLSGTIISGDIDRLVGAPVQTGQLLFEIADLSQLYAEIGVPESRIADVAVGQTGRLATASYPDRKVAFEVERITPVAEQVDGQNIFRVRVRMIDPPDWLRPGMRGEARITTGRTNLGGVLFRDLADWLRMRLWW